MNYFAILKLWLSLLNKDVKNWIIITLTALFVASVWYHTNRENKWDEERVRTGADLKACEQSKEMQRKFQQAYMLDRYSELKADRDTAFARLDRLTQKIKNQ